MSDTLGNRIRDVRQQKKMTLEALAKQTRLSKGFLSDLENDKRDVGTRNLIKIADALDTSMEWLARGRKSTDRIKCPACDGSGMIDL